MIQRLAWVRPPVPVITVAGTNGKGSVVATSSAILTAAGYRVGVFTSPHIRDYRERIRIAGRDVQAHELIDAFARIEAARGEIPLTFFEYNALAAFLIFTAAELDVWVLEIGLGGRLDAVNVVDPDVAVVVSISLDHQEYLGDTLEAIGREKAGIFRAGRAAVLGSRAMPASVEETARAVGARVKRLGTEFDYQRDGAAWHYRGTRWDFRRLPQPALYGATQYDNSAAAIAALEELPALTRLDRDSVTTGLGAVRLTGRFQVVVPPVAAASPTWILDVAHNPDAARVLAQNLATLPAAGRTVAICGILIDKDAVSIVNSMRERFAAWYFVDTTGERGRSAAKLAAAVAASLDVPVQIAATLDEACEAALTAAGPQDRVVIFGSFHTVGPALDWLESKGWL